MFVISSFLMEMNQFNRNNIKLIFMKKIARPSSNSYPLLLTPSTLPGCLGIVMGWGWVNAAKVCEFRGNTILSSLMEQFESVQYSAALAVTGTWRGTSREKLYSELGWESLSPRRWSRRLTLFYKMINKLMPEYTLDPIPPLQQSHYSLRNQDIIGQIRTRTEKLKSSFYPDCLTE